MYPWGNDFAVGYKVPAQSDQSATDHIGSNPADISADGVFDMGASVSEWTSSWFEPYPGTKYESRYWGEEARTRLKVARGGSWWSVGRGEKTAAVQCRTTYREVQYSWRRGHPFMGFRLAMDAKLAPPRTEGEGSTGPEEGAGPDREE
jgi:iron(II)-dependent oxidoreductase